MMYHHIYIYMYILCALATWTTPRAFLRQGVLEAAGRTELSPISWQNSVGEREKPKSKPGKGYQKKANTRHEICPKNMSGRSFFMLLGVLGASGAHLGKRVKKVTKI